MPKIKNSDTRKLLQALERYGCQMRFNSSHAIVFCPKGRAIMSTKSFHRDKQWKDLGRLGIDLERLRSLL